jgi:tetratricopeptide (TPR) repeat protein
MKTSEPNLSWYQVPREIEILLRSAAQSWNSQESDRYMQEALALCDTNLDVLVSAYRYFFYKHNDRQALQITHKVIEQIQKNEQLPQDWEQLKPILSDRKEDYAIRLYLNAYSASGLVLARLGEIEKAKEITAKVKEVDDKNEFGASVDHLLSQDLETCPRTHESK